MASEYEREQRPNLVGIASPLCALLVVLLVPAGSLEAQEALGFPVSLGLEALGEASKERRELTWEVQVVHETGIRSFQESHASPEERRFLSGEEELVVRVDGKEEFLSLAWGLLFSAQPGEVRGLEAQRFQGAFSVEILGNELALCFGIEEKICFEENLRFVSYLRIRQGEQVWEFQTTQRGKALQISVDGGLKARFRGRG